jgi:hypothetical protein
MADTFINIPNSGSPSWKNPVANPASLPLLGNTNGDARVDLSTDTIYVWNGTSWIAVATPGAAIAIDGLIGDVSASGPGVVAATVNFVGGVSAANVALGANAANAATNLNTASTIVRRDASGNFSAGTITATNLTISSLTPGSVLFAGSSGQISQDNANFYWNDSTFNLGLGVIPATNITIDTVNTTGVAKAIQNTSYGVGSSVPFRGRFARGTIGSPAPAQAGDTLSVLSGRGYGTSQFAAASTGIVNILAGETFSNTSNATYITFSTTPTGSVTAVERMRINSTGNVLIDTITDNGVDSLQIGSGIASNYVKFTGSTSGYVEFIANSTTTSYNLSLPAAQGSASSYLQNDGSGNLSWVTSGSPPTVTSNIDGGSSATLYTSPQIVNGGTP